VGGGITKGADVRNYRPIACLPTTLKLLTGIVAKHVYGHLHSNGLLLDEQKGCTRKTPGTNDQLLIDGAEELQKKMNESKHGMNRLQEGLRHVATLVDSGISDVNGNS